MSDTPRTDAMVLEEETGTNDYKTSWIRAVELCRTLEREVVNVQSPLNAWRGKPCAKCGVPVHPPTSRYQKAVMAFGDRVWHGDCAPSEIHGTFIA